MPPHPFSHIIYPQPAKATHKSMSSQSKYLRQTKKAGKSGAVIRKGDEYWYPDLDVPATSRGRSKQEEEKVQSGVANAAFEDRGGVLQRAGGVYQLVIAISNRHSSGPSDQQTDIGRQVRRDSKIRLKTHPGWSSSLADGEPESPGPAGVLWTPTPPISHSYRQHQTCLPCPLLTDWRRCDADTVLPCVNRSYKGIIPELEQSCAVLVVPSKAAGEAARGTIERIATPNMDPPPPRQMMRCPGYMRLWHATLYRDRELYRRKNMRQAASIRPAWDENKAHLSWTSTGKRTQFSGRYGVNQAMCRARSISSRRRPRVGMALPSCRTRLAETLNKQKVGRPGQDVTISELCANDVLRNIITISGIRTGKPTAVLGRYISDPAIPIQVRRRGAESLPCTGSHLPKADKARTRTARRPYAQPRANSFLKFYLCKSPIVSFAELHPSFKNSTDSGRVSRSANTFLLQFKFGLGESLDLPPT
ncbi:hypothetical protein EVG20_g11409 [Dentipellis fragilis]|uniref:Uncharacterized protein n=1 Tax=Dentipellis fragilis TaxID=205917 RepID=A0A4Y9XMR2_9AGAM|nr:hypothetical protein EVG20_g11409 [Dentipellis fragilis]